MAKFVDPGEDLDLGVFGYSAELLVMTVHPVTAEWLEKIRMPMVQARGLLDAEAWHVHCAEYEDGTGQIDDIWLHRDDAAHFAVGDRIVYHYRRDSVPGYGELAYIEREPKAIALGI